MGNTTTRRLDPHAGPRSLSSQQALDEIFAGIRRFPFMDRFGDGHLESQLVRDLRLFFNTNAPSLQRELHLNVFDLIHSFNLNDALEVLDHDLHENFTGRLSADPYVRATYVPISGQRNNLLGLRAIEKRLLPGKEAAALSVSPLKASNYEAYERFRNSIITGLDRVDNSIRNIRDACERAILQHQRTYQTAISHAVNNMPGAQVGGVNPFPNGVVQNIAGILSGQPQQTLYPVTIGANGQRTLNQAKTRRRKSARRCVNRKNKRRF